MSTKVFYYFCRSCGADTAAYEMYSACPYCHAGRREFQLVGECTSDSERREVQERLKGLRSRWMEEQGGTPGERKRRGLRRR
jgi:hypothetical protein